MLEGCAQIEVKLMSRVLGRLWGHQGRLWETPWAPQTNLGVRKGPLGSSSWSQVDPWSVQVGCKSVQVGCKSVQVDPRFFQGGAKGEPRWREDDRPTDGPNRPPARRPTARPIIYTNSRSTASAAPYYSIISYYIYIIYIYIYIHTHIHTS